MKTRLLQLMRGTGLILICTLSMQAQTVADFENISLSADSYLNGSGPNIKSTFISGDVVLPNTYASAYGGYWQGGFTYSNKTDSTTADFTNLYSARPAGGYSLSANYVVGQPHSVIKLSGTSMGKPVNGLYITNSTYAALSMRDGDFFAKKFGGISGNDPDTFLLVVKGYFNGTITTDSVNFYLADFRFSNNSQDYIVKDWQWMDLTSLGNVDSLQFNLVSSDMGAFGMNTPAFFCIDNISTFSGISDFENLTLFADSYWKGGSATFKNNFISGNVSFNCAYSVSDYGDYWSEGFAISNKADSVTAGYTNLYSARTAKGYNSSSNYAVCQQDAKIKLTGNALGKVVNGFYVTNGTYATISMQDGDAFGKKFGGVSGNDADWFMLTVKNYYQGVMTDDSVNFYLADYRFSNNAQDYIIKTWQWVDLTSLGNVDSLVFKLSSSDVGMYGMNTPGFFCMDNFTTADSPLAISEINNNKLSINLFPNPSIDNININLENFRSERVLVQIIDVTGKPLYSETTNSLSLQIPVAYLPNGIYHLKVTGNNFEANKAFIKQ